VRTQRYGMVRGLTDNHAYPARWVTDASLSYTLARKYTLTAGADNLLDTYPERAPALVSPLGFPMPPAQVNSYDASSPFGFNGRYVYGRLSIYL
jgi:iron complex outermembrane recepter protein